MHVERGWLVVLVGESQAIDDRKTVVDGDGVALKPSVSATVAGEAGTPEEKLLSAPYVVLIASDSLPPPLTL